MTRRLAFAGVAVAVTCVGCAAGSHNADQGSPATDSTSGTTTATETPSCAVLAQRYYALVRGARICDPAVADSCSAMRPRTVAEVPSGTTEATFDPSMINDVSGCPCGIPMNPAHLTELDAALAAFDAACTRLPTPGCCVPYLDSNGNRTDPPPATCSVVESDGTTTCSAGRP